MQMKKFKVSYITDACVVIEASEFVIFALGGIGPRRHYGTIAVPDHFKIIEGYEAVRVFVSQGRYFDLKRNFRNQTCNKPSSCHDIS